MTDSETIDQAAEENQRDQAEGERNDDVERRVTRGTDGEKDETTRQQSVADHDPAEGARDDT